MARGTSGRIVIEVDPKVKKDLYKALAEKEMTLKDWFLQQTEEYLKSKDQLKIFNS